MPAAPVHHRGPGRPGDPPHLGQQHPVLSRDERGEGGERRPSGVVCTAHQSTRTAFAATALPPAAWFEAQLETLAEG
ncbi:hypothetical protein [Streptomyces sp. NBC_01296]|uniref:hypothetical protein n=1 Tax=Streptomyces sp. NBC_01296 TaxID=2903816 RepID=UPI002E1121B8|nr:hypothetical protein OG299_38440 [Streptomyces sp. NBC_01296]